MPNEQQNSLNKLWDLISDVKVAMLTTADEEGCLRSRPMVTQHDHAAGELWFFTPASSGKVREVGREQHVNVSYSLPDKERYVSISGRAEMVKDPEKIKQLWSPLLKAWFPKGADDPDILLLKVKIDRAEYWDAPSSKMVHLLGMARAAATGERYTPGEHGEVRLS